MVLRHLCVFIGRSSQVKRRHFLCLVRLVLGDPARWTVQGSRESTVECIPSFQNRRCSSIALQSYTLAYNFSYYTRHFSLVYAVLFNEGTLFFSHKKLASASAKFQQNEQGHRFYKQIKIMSSWSYESVFKYETNDITFLLSISLKKNTMLEF